VNLWRSNLLLGIQEEALIQQFNKQVDLEYKSLLQDLAKKNPEVSKISQEYQQIMGKDYFQSEIGAQVKQKLLALRGETE